VPRHKNLCFVIADGGHARFARPAPDNALHTFEAVDSATVHKHDRDLVSDRPGRAFESGASAARHAYVPRTDPHELAKQQFAELIAERINAESAADVFHELVVVAPASILAEITAALDAPTRAKLVGSLAKDLVKTPDHELQPHLKQWVRPVHRA
jgi:protein required for attachment to host cells